MGLRQAVRDIQSKYNQEDLPEFDAQRRRLYQQLQDQAQAQREGLDRGFARIGGGPAGAKLKLAQQLEENIGKTQQAGEEQLSAQELAMRRQLAEADKQRMYATAEREAGQKFAGEQNVLQRDFARQERESGQGFAGEQNALQREFAKGERLSGQEFQQRNINLENEFKNKVFNADQESKVAQLELQRQQFALEQDVASFNKEMARMEANKPTDLMGSLFGPAFSTGNGGALGGGLGMGLIGAGVGGFFGGPAGAAIGGGIGASIGSMF
jgi:hypothetical protein